MNERIDITIDTREQTPWAFDPQYATCRIGTLKTADYALTGDTGFGIERKTLDDFLGTVSSGWGRFQREIERMETWPAKVIIVEGDFEDVCFREWNGEIIAPDHNHPQLTPQFVTKRIAELTMRGVSVLFAKNADYAAALALQIFRERNNTRNV